MYSFITFPLPFFFFQAEDGIRDGHVTGVQTCALPISLIRRIAADSPAGERRFDAAAPILDMPLTDGSRLNAILDVSHQPAVSIRRHRYRTTGLGELRRLGTLDTLLAKLLPAEDRARRYNVIY